MTGYFFDTSALAKLYHFERGSDYLSQLIGRPSTSIWVSRLSIVEMESVLSLKVRSRHLDQHGLEIARRRFRADLAQRRIVTGPPIEDKHLNAARQLLADYGSLTDCGYWMRSNSQSLLI